MKILHVSDFHYRGHSSYKFDQQRIVDALCSSLKSQQNIEFVLFTGDLVFTGANIDDFKHAKILLLDAIKTNLNLQENSIFICEGNHDVNRNQEMGAIQDKILQLKNNDELNRFVVNEQREYIESLRNHENYLKFQDEFYESNLNDIINPLYTVHKRKYDEKTLGIATINTSWRSLDSNKDRGNLLFPTSHIKQIIDEVKGTDLKILILHHPLSDLKDFNSFEIEDLIYQNFDLMLSGHVHKNRLSTHITNGEGIFCGVSPAVLTYENDTSIGYIVYDIDLENFDINVSKFVYEKSSMNFYLSESLSVKIPLNKSKEDQNIFRRTLRDKYLEEIEFANDLFLGDSEDHKENFLKLFTAPVLKNKSKAELQGKVVETPNIPLESIINDSKSYLIFGKDKSGKTSLLTKIKLQMLEEFSIHKILPFYIDYKQIKVLNRFDLIKEISRYYRVSRAQVKELIHNYSFKLLIDNYNINIDNLENVIVDFLNLDDKISFLACTDDTLTRNCESIQIGNKEHYYLFIHEISRMEIRELARKWPGLKDDKREIILSKILQIFYQLKLPVNFWTVSLFIWVFEKNSDTNIHNNFDLIQLYIDSLLDRTKFIHNKTSKINFEDFKVFISEFAHFLITKFSDSIYSCEYHDLIKFIEDYRIMNQKFVISVQEIAELLLEKGIIKKLINDRYTFRLNGVFEYFIAYYMNNNIDFRNDAIDDSHYYLSFGNEFELCSGFNRWDESFLKSIFKKTIDIFESTNSNYISQGSIDSNLQNKINQVYEHIGHYKIISMGQSVALSPQNQDLLMEEIKPIDIQRTEVERKKFYLSIESNPENLEKSLFILSRVFRNSTLKNRKLNNEVLDFILDSACNLGFTLIDDESKLENGKNSWNDKKDNVILKLISNFMPLIVQTFLYDSLAQNNLDRMLKDKILILRKEKNQNQFKLLLLYLIVLDLDLNGNRSILDDAINDLNVGVLLNTLLIKLHFYLVFKTHNKQELSDYLVSKIQNINIKINPKYDRREFDIKIEQQRKIALINSKKSL